VKRSETSGTIPKTNPTPAKGWRNFPTHDVPVALVTGFLGRSAYQECRCAPLRALVLAYPPGAGLLDIDRERIGVFRPQDVPFPATSGLLHVR
jgi:hypothetical protein